VQGKKRGGGNPAWPLPVVLCRLLGLFKPIVLCSCLFLPTKEIPTFSYIIFQCSKFRNVIGIIHHNKRWDCALKNVLKSTIMLRLGKYDVVNDIFPMDLNFKRTL
jgi:hypothetical protein